MSKFVEFFRDADEGENADRQRWASRDTFVLAAIGSAIGLGNFWRFPYLCFKWGGALFFIPYLICLFFLGLPMLMLEFSLGQFFQRGDIGVFRGIHPRLAGIGLASVFASFAITFYYNVIIAWSMVYLFTSFKYPLPWSKVYATNRAKTSKDCAGLYLTEEYFFKDILHIYDQYCTSYDTNAYLAGNHFQHTEFQWQVFLCALATWVIVYFCVFKGVKSSSYVVWVTVPLPVLFIFIMVMRGLTLENADQGIRMYLLGEVDGVRPDVGEKLANGSMWSEACAQIFFSIGVCMGVMTSYSSYNDQKKKVIGDSFRVAFGNSALSFFAGFAVFSVVGYLQGIDSPIKNKTSSIGLAFIAYPAAIDTLSGPNFWTFVLSVVLFSLGIDSAFSLVEATSTVVSDTDWGKKTPRKLTAMLLCALGACFSTVFCFNWGFTYFDTVDHYLAVYFMLLLGIFQCFGAGWVYDMDKTIEKSSKTSVWILFGGYWGSTILMGILSLFAFPNGAIWGMIANWVIIFIFVAISYFTSGQNPQIWYEKVFLYGVRKLARGMTSLEHDKFKAPWWRGPFELWWGFSIKYFIPWAIWFLLMFTLKADLDPNTYSHNSYGNYHIFWQIMGFLYPIVGLVLFFVPMFLCTQQEEFAEQTTKWLDEIDA